jgi:hypothetical protein
MQMDFATTFIEASSTTAFDFDIGDAFSFTFWHKDYFGLFRPLATKIDVGGYRFLRDTGAQLLVQFLYSPSQYIYVRTTTAVPSSGWHHYSITYDGSGLPSGIKVYFDGVPQPMTTLVNSFPIAGSMITTQNFLIGAQLPTLFVPGNHGQMRCWDIELAPADVVTEYNFGLIGTAWTQGANLVAAPDIASATFNGTTWDFPDLTGNSTFTSSGLQLGDRVDDCPV